VFDPKLHFFDFALLICKYALWKLNHFCIFTMCISYSAITKAPLWCGVLSFAVKMQYQAYY